MKKLLLAIAVAASFLAGFGISANAYVDRCWYCGYFTNGYDSYGDNVIQNNANDGWGHYNSSTGGYDAIPPSVNSIDEFISFIYGKLNSTRVDYGTANNATNWDRTAAAFIIQTMLGNSRNRPPSGAEISEWETRVRHAASLNHINWGTYVSAYPNTFYQINRNDGSSYLNDVAWYPDTGSGTAIVFYRDDGSVGYIIRRQCANPIGDLPGVSPASWSGSARTTVTDNDGAAPGDTPTEISVRPGATVTFNHTITNNGPASAPNINYSINSHNGQEVPWTGQYYSNVSLSGSPTFTRQDTNIAFDWGTGSPGGGLPVDNFSIRWTKTVNLPASYYYFTVVGDDGVRFYLDGVLRLDAWVAQGATAYTYYVASLPAGNHTLQVDYFESGGPGYSRFDYSNSQSLGYQSSGSYGIGTKTLFSPEVVNVPANAAPGTQYCRRIYMDPKNSWGGGDYGMGSGSFAYMACATVTGSYTLVPTVTPSATVVSQGDTATFTYTVRNSGDIVSPSITCSITGTQPAGTPAPPATNCPRTIPTGPTGVQVTNAIESIPISTQPAGSQICRTLTINPTSSTNSASTSAGPVCITVAKKPYVQFKGGDVWAGGGFLQPDGTCTTNTGAKITTVSSSGSSAGSTSEYGTFALGDVTKFGSGNKALYDSANFADLGRRLVFSNNTTTLGRLGAPQHCLKDYSSIYDSLPVGGALAITNTTSGAWHSSSFPSLSGTAPAGVKKVYYSDTDVTITGDIKYPDTYNSVDEIPSIIVIAKGNIYVNAGVTRMDGIYIARNTFYTCYPKPTPLSNTVCNTQLNVNGAVIAGTLDLYRTFGGDGATQAARQTPAEIFNLSPEVFLSNALTSSVGQSVGTSDSRELPPRF